MTRSQREDRIARISAPAASGAHRRTVAAGAVAQLRDPMSVPLRQRARAQLMVREAGLTGAAMSKRLGGRGTVEFSYPGSEGHEKCRQVCLTYG